MIKLAIIILVSLITLQTISQDYFEDVKKISGKFSSDYLSIDVIATTFDIYGNQKYKTKAMIRKSKLKSYTNHLDVEIFDDGSETLIIDHETKEITLFIEPKDKINNKSDFDFEAQLETIRKSIDTVIFLGDKSGVRTYRMETKDDLISSINIAFNLDNFTLKKIVYNYNQEKTAHLETSYSTIEYTKFKVDPISNNFFLKKKYILKDKGNYKVTPSFSNYKLEVI